MEPCSQSISTQSKPSRPMMSTMWGDGNITETPNAGLPDRSLCFIWLGSMGAAFVCVVVVGMLHQFGIWRRLACELVLIGEFEQAPEVKGA